MRKEKESPITAVVNWGKEEVYRLVYRGPDDEIPSAVYDSIEILYKNYPMKPFIFRKRLIEHPKQLHEYKAMLMDGDDNLPIVKPEKIEKAKLILPKNRSAEEILRFIRHRPKKKQTWFLVVHLPPGCEYSEFKSKEKHFATAVGGSCEIERVGAAVYMTISNIALSRVYDFVFDPLPYLKKMHLPIFLGYSISGPIVIDLAEFVTILVGGLRGAGKSVLFHGIIYTLLRMNTDPLNPYVIVCIIDPKIKEFRIYEEYGAIWVHDIEEIRELLDLIDKENTRRQNLIGGKANNILEYNALGHNLPFIVLVNDEAADLAEDKICKQLMLKSVRKHRSQGIYNLAATQRPDAKAWGGTNEFAQFKSQFEARVSYRTADAVNSQLFIDSDKAAYLPKIPGRAIYKYDSELEIQSAYFPSKAKNPEKFYTLMNKLHKVPLPYEDIEGEVHDYEPLYPRPRVSTGPESSSGSRTLRLLKSGANPFA